MNASFVEVSSPGLALWRALVDTCVGLVVGVLYAFVGILVTGIVGEEALSSLYSELDLDPLFRAGMGVILVAGAALGLGVPLIVAAERFAALRAVERSALTHPDAAPQRPLRAELTAPPAAQLRIAGWIVFWIGASLGGLLAIGLLVAEDLRGDVESWIGLAVLGGLVVIGGALARLGRWGVERTAGRMQRLKSRWGSLVPAAEEADARRRAGLVEVEVPRWLVVPGRRALNRIATVLLSATLVSLGVFMLSVFLRQQCRGCEPIRWNEPIENGIDVLSLGSGIAIATCATLAGVAWVGGILLQAVREIALVRWATQDGPRRVEVAALSPLLAENRAMVRLQFGASAAGAALLIVGIAALWADWTLADAQRLILIGGGFIAVGFLLGWTDAARSVRERQAVRDATFPGDSAREGDSTAGVEAGARRRRR